MSAVGRLWFDVGIKRYTTSLVLAPVNLRLWFDVGIKRYTTGVDLRAVMIALWFDVGIKRYTTVVGNIHEPDCCGLM